MLHERHSAVLVQPPLVLHRHAETEHPLEEGAHQRTAQVLIRTEVDILDQRGIDRKSVV